MTPEWQSCGWNWRYWFGHHVWWDPAALGAGQGEGRLWGRELYMVEANASDPHWEWYHCTGPLCVPILLLAPLWNVSLKYPSKDGWTDGWIDRYKKVSIQPFVPTVLPPSRKTSTVAQNMYTMYMLHPQVGQVLASLASLPQDKLCWVLIRCDWINALWYFLHWHSALFGTVAVPRLGVN